MLGVAEVDQGVQALDRLEDDVAALAAVAAVGAAIFDIFLAPEADRARPAGAGADEDLGLVEEMHGPALSARRTGREERDMPRETSEARAFGALPYPTYFALGVPLPNAMVKCLGPALGEGGGMEGEDYEKRSYLHKHGFKYDIFFSYAHGDVGGPAEAPLRQWSRQFKETLERYVNSVLRHRTRVFSIEAGMARTGPYLLAMTSIGRSRLPGYFIL